MLMKQLSHIATFMDIVFNQNHYENCSIWSRWPYWQPHS